MHSPQVLAHYPSRCLNRPCFSGLFAAAAAAAAVAAAADGAHERRFAAV